MSLDFSVERMNNFEVLTSIPNPYGQTNEDGTPKLSWHPLTDALIWATMAIGMNEITEKNWIEFYQRLHAVEKVSGPYLWRGEIDKHDRRNFITPLEVYMHIGLHTNASSKTLKQFQSDLYELSTRHSSDLLKKVPELYKDLSIETLSKDEWFPLWNFKDSKHYSTEDKVKEIRAPEEVSQN